MWLLGYQGVAMRLLGYLGWLLGVARVLGLVARVLLGYLGWLLGCC